ncbi:MAG TPA: hypothetical protein VEA61_13590, partial [Allosphingosinicella sp.]|nr:hypothetical protein [Allosphingosinicella sp.]
MSLIRARTLVLLAAAGLGLAACSYGRGYGYGGVSVGYGGGYCDPYWDDCYGGGYYDPWYGWYDGYYYPGWGFFVYDQWRRPHRWNDYQRRYWERHRPDAGIEQDLPARARRRIACLDGIEIGDDAREHRRSHSAPGPR